ncbi:MAG: hypothetical protein A2V76_11015 [Candidatus Aminicenantes bacterium RBG_16_63_14]|nr:MAG: hypothetical protein A2V76_11015 [Candidatus Aminicenantes bacterium RBG_16_63_14]OGD26007.1 MAG: hypothetical protein A2V57_10495 [Candidatus Aminicenantes bacterium RBG_19FT_COMBO_65_30]
MNKQPATVSALIVWILISAVTGMGKDRVVVSPWAETAVTIDGHKTDWAGATLQTMKKLKIDYAFKNDGADLYVLFIFNDPRSLSSIEATGMTLYFAAENNKGADHGLRFTRKALTSQELIALFEKEGQQLTEERKQEILSKLGYTIFECSLVNKKGRVLTENVGRISSNPPSFNLAKTEGSIVYEFRVPLAKTEIQPAGIEAKPGTALKVGFSWGGVTPEMRDAIAKQSGYAGGQAGAEASSFEILTEDIGLEGGGGGSSFGSRMAQLQRTTQKHEFWVDVLLTARGS